MFGGGTGFGGGAATGFGGANTGFGGGGNTGFGGAPTNNAAANPFGGGAANNMDQRLLSFYQGRRCDCVVYVELILTVFLFFV